MGSSLQFQAVAIQGEAWTGQKRWEWSPQSSCRVFFQGSKPLIYFLWLGTSLHEWSNCKDIWFPGSKALLSPGPVICDEDLIFVLGSTWQHWELQGAPWGTRWSWVPQARAPSLLTPPDTFLCELLKSFQSTILFTTLLGFLSQFSNLFVKKFPFLLDFPIGLP